MERERASYQLTFAVLATGAIAYSLLQSLVIPAIPALKGALHTSTAGASWVLTAYLLASASATPILGRLGDKLGKERVLVIVLVGLTVGTLISAVATSLPLMIVGRVVQGAGGGIFPLAFGIIRDEFPPEKVASAIGIMSALLGIGGGAGIVFAGPILEHLSYHWLFWIPLVLAGFAAVVTHFVVPESPVRTGGGINWGGAVLMSGGLVALLVAVAQGPAWGWGNTTVIELFAVAVVILVAWVVAEVRSSAPLVDMRMMRIPTVWRTNLAAALFGFGMFGMFIIVPQFVQAPKYAGYGFSASVTASGLYLLPVPVAMLIVAPFTGRITQWIGSKPILVAGGVSGFASYAVMAIWHGSPAPIYIGTTLIGVAIAFGFASMTNLVVEAVPRSQTGVATGMNTNLRNIGGALGSGIATSVVLSVHGVRGLPGERGFTMAFWLCAAALGIAGAAASIVPRRVTSPHGVLAEPHPSLTAEGETFVGAIALGPEDLA